MRTTKESVYLGKGGVFVGHRSESAIVVGSMLGPMLLCVGCSIEEAVDEFDERYGRRVGADDPDLADYGDDPEDAIEQAIACGDIRTNDGGTTVWVDPYEWSRSFPSVKEAAEFCRGGWNR